MADENTGVMADESVKESSDICWKAFQRWFL
jgi:hypothetical protein